MLTNSENRGRLEEWLRQQGCLANRLVSVRHLTGGASRDTWLLECEVDGTASKLILRADCGGEIQPNALSRESEYHLIRMAHEAGVLVPRPRALCTDAAVLGVDFFVMDFIQGESVGSRVVREESLQAARARLPGQMADQLARIHAIHLTQALPWLPAEPGSESPARLAVDATLGHLHALGEPHPVLEWAGRWLIEHAPKCCQAAIVHGDFRIGNMLVNQAGLAGIIDWEFCHIGDPMEDVGWPLVRSWRFSKPDKRFGGVADAGLFLSAYALSSGRPIDARHVFYWEILGNLRWAVGCVAQADRHLSGRSRSIELASLGRRSAEMELELLNLIEAWDRGGLS